ncbi:WbqC family protein [Puia sp.]|uniref:WbqC family protein n=1 Tax=Puia sp. TaxID=2045100 RepID=UPI002F3EE6CB
MNLITDIQYFPSVIFYKNSYNFSHITIEQCETWQKMSFRNRCQIAGAEGVINLSIPLVNGRDQKALIRDVRIAGSLPWQAQHWKTIVSCYNRSPWFAYYRDELEQLYRKPANYLLDWNWDCLEWSFRVLGMTRSLSRTPSYKVEYTPAEGVDQRGMLMPKDREKWGAGTPRYHQVFEERTGFLPGLSILDLVFCEGKNGIRYIQS